MTKLQINPKYGQSPASSLPESAELKSFEKPDSVFAQDSVAFSLGLWPAISRPAPKVGATAKQLLGTDFSHVIVTR